MLFSGGNTCVAAVRNYRDHISPIRLKKISYRLKEVPNMAFCTKCGTQVKEGEKFCPTCGAVIGEPQQAVPPQPHQPGQGQQPYQQPPQQPFQQVQQTFQNVMNTPDSTQQMDPDDIAQNKIFAILSYFGILLLIPWFAAPQSKFARFHAKQGINLLIVDIAVGVLHAIFSAIFAVRFLGVYMGTPVWVTVIFSLLWLCVAALAVIGIVNAATGKAKELPVIGKWKIIK
jgi:uncharacterized membrane protein